MRKVGWRLALAGLMAFTLLLTPGATQARDPSASDIKGKFTIDCKFKPIELLIDLTCQTFKPCDGASAFTIRVTGTAKSHAAANKEVNYHQALVIENVTLADVLEFLTVQYGLEYRQQWMESTLVVTVDVKPVLDPGQPSIDSQVWRIPLNYISPAFAKQVLDTYGIKVTARNNNFKALLSTATASTMNFSLPSAFIPPSVSEDKDEEGQYDPIGSLNTSPTNVIVFRGTPSDYIEVRRIINTIDLRPEQIMLQVKVCEMNETAMKELGIEYPSSVGATWTEKNDSPRTEFEAFSLGDFNRGATGMSFTSTLQAQILRGNIEVLAQPTLTTLDGDEAKYFAGEFVPYIKKSVVNNQSDSRTTDVSYFSLGINLTFKPRVEHRASEKFYSYDGNDGGFLHWRPDGNQSSSSIHYVPTDYLVIGVQPSIDSVGIYEELIQNEVRAPRFLTRRLDAKVYCESGEPFVLAGLIQQEDRVDISRVPILSELPIAGKLFRKKKTESIRTEVVIIVIPHILDRDGKCTCQLCQEQSYAEFCEHCEPTNELFADRSKGKTEIEPIVLIGNEPADRPKQGLNISDSEY